MARAWRKGDDATLSELTLAAPTPGEGRVLVEVEGAAIDPFAATPRGRVPGVAAVGRVRAVGAAAGEWQDARVLVPMLAPCGECDRCRRGGVALCPDGAAHGVDGPGTLATTITAAARWLVRLEAPLALPGPAAAALGGELALAYALYARAGVGPREPTIVWGRGAIARAAAAILDAKGAPAHVATDDPALAEALRARGTSAGEATAAAATAALAGHDPRRPRRVIVTAPELLPAALEAAGPRATVVTLAGPGAAAAPALALDRALATEVTLTGVAGCHPDLVPELVALAVRGELALDELVEVVPLAEAAAHLGARQAAPTPRSLVVALPAA